MMTPAHYVLPLIDLTSLNGNESAADISKLVEQAFSEFGPTAAVCVYPANIADAKAAIGERQMPIATVTNFPSGDLAIDEVVAQTQAALAAGADEIDVVFPYRRFIAGDVAYAQEFMRAISDIMPDDKCLKVILESGCFDDMQQLRAACDLCLDAGVDMLKTSTGKVEVNATLPAADVMLAAIAANGDDKVGFKAAGGIRTVAEAIPYLELVARHLGDDALCAQRCRIGASSLLQDVLAALDGSSNSSSNSGY